MYQVITGNEAPQHYADLLQAAKTLMPLNILNGPRVTDSNGLTLIEVEWRYIPGDCYEPSGYVGTTPEARVALRCANAMRRINDEIRHQAAEAKKGLKGLTFQTRSDKGAVAVNLAWDHWCGFTMEILEAETGYIVYSRWLDSALHPRNSDEAKPTLEHFASQAANLGIVLPEYAVDVIRRRSLLND